MKTIRIMVVDDNAEFLAFTSEYLSAVDGFEVVAALASGMEGVERAQALQPDVIVLDLAMPGIDGLEMARQITAAAKAPQVIILSLQDDPEYRIAAQKAGAVGFVCKDRLSTELVPCIISCFEARGRLPQSAPKSEGGIIESRDGSVSEQ